MTVPSIFHAVLNAFGSEFSPATWTRVITLITGTILARGRRSVTAALRSMGLDDDPHLSSYYQILNRGSGPRSPQWFPRGPA